MVTDATHQTIPRISSATHLPHTYTILVAEDNSINQTLIRHLLKGWGVSFDIVANGNEALNKLSEKKYDLILMDIQMPEMDGYTATRHIRSVLQMDMPIIAMTAHALRGEKEKCLASGMNDYISKPIDAGLLLEILAKFSPAVAEPNISAKNAGIGNAFTFIKLQYMHAISNGDVEYEKLVTEQFIEMLPEHLQALEYDFTANNITPLQQTAHNMKTTVSIMGLTDRLEPLLHTIESGGGIGNQSMQRTIQEIKTICEAALTEARLFYNTL
jgi:CheY-like chemotaxis protein